MIHLFLRKAIAAHPDREDALNAFDMFWNTIANMPAPQREGHLRAIAREFFDFNYAEINHGLTCEPRHERVLQFKMTGTPLRSPARQAVCDPH